MLAMEAAYQVGEKPVTAAIAESVMSKQIDELEPKLTRNGYDVRGLAEQFHDKPEEITPEFFEYLRNNARAKFDKILPDGVTFPPVQLLIL